MTGVRSGGALYGRWHCTCRDGIGGVAAGPDQGMNCHKQELALGQDMESLVCCRVVGNVRKAIQADNRY